MGIFNFFNKDKNNNENKEELDKGLKKTNENFFQKLSRVIVGKNTIDDEVLDNLEEILIESDVGV
ncbi:MAG: signal recognition particle receptor subunit alpha, partial [Bacteroidales bacterium]|nr:signal recognition particle receptor subunit alpha [Bacteroidales bacterium]